MRMSGMWKQEHMKKIAIIRGANLNKFEMQTFEVLQGKFDICAIASRKPVHAIHHIDLPVRRLICSTDLANLLPGVLGRLGNFMLSQIIGINQMIFGLEKQLQAINIVHTADPSYYYSYQAAKLKEKLAFKLVVTQWENLPFNFEWTVLQRKVKHTVLKMADHFVAVSERARETLILEGADPQRILVLPPGIDTERFRPREKDPDILRAIGASEKDLIISFVGKLNYSKGVEFLLYAFKKLISDPEVANLGRRLKLVFFGRGRKEKKLKMLVEKFDISQDVIFYGPYPYDNIHNVYNTSDIFVLPSVPNLWWQEQLGMVLLESMASECAVVGASSGAIPEVIGDAGLLCQSGDFFDLYDKLRMLCLNRELRAKLGKRARERVLQKYDSKQNAANLGEIYENL